MFYMLFNHKFSGVFATISNIALMVTFNN